VSSVASFGSAGAAIVSVFLRTVSWRCSSGVASEASSVAAFFA
jgi:hypothetical protein